LRQSRIAINLAGIAAISLALSAAAVECRLPVPDGSDEKPSTPNLHGVIAEVRGRSVEIRQAKTGRLIIVRLAEKPEIYSAFGGDGDLADLAPGQTVWVWFVKCRWPKSGAAEAAYFQIYSKDPNDKPGKQKPGTR